jgi:hypothetical protein
MGVLARAASFVKAMPIVDLVSFLPFAVHYQLSIIHHLPSTRAPLRTIWRNIVVAPHPSDSGELPVRPGFGDFKTPLIPHDSSEPCGASLSHRPRLVHNCDDSLHATLQTALKARRNAEFFRRG